MPKEPITISEWILLNRIIFKYTVTVSIMGVQRHSLFIENPSRDEPLYEAFGSTFQDTVEKLAYQMNKFEPIKVSPILTIPFPPIDWKESEKQ